MRFYEFDKVLRSGELYPRWAPDFNYGYGIPLFNYVYPLPNYIASLFHLLGFSFIDGFKLNMAVASILSSIFMFLWARRFWGTIGGFVSSVFYTYSPYHFLDVYIRGSVGEVWGLALFPAFLWAFTELIYDGYGRFFVLSSVFFALTIFSHNILALIFISFAIFYSIFLSFIMKKKNVVKKFVGISTLGIGVSAIFWVPALFEKDYVTGLQIFDVSQHFPQLYQLLIPSWGSGFSASGIEGQMSFQIGVANILGIFISCIFFLFRKKTWQYKFLFSFFGSTFFIIFLLMLKISLPIWKLVPLLQFFQFPWRLLSLEILIASFLIGSIFYVKKITFKYKALAIILCSISIATTIVYTKPAYYHQRNDRYYIERSNFIDGTNSPGNFFNTIWFSRSLKKRPEEKVQIVESNGKIASKKISPTSIELNLITYKPSKILLNIAYFPGWSVYVNNINENIVNEKGLISFYIPNGNHKILVKLETTGIQKIASIISLVSFTILLFCLLNPSLLQ